MTPFVAAQIHSIIEDIRLLEAFVTAPLRLHSDIRTLRQALPLPEAEHLSLEESQKRRIGYRALTCRPALPGPGYPKGKNRAGGVSGGYSI